MNRGMQALCGCCQSGGAAAPHARSATPVHASVGIDRRGTGRLSRGQQPLVRNSSDALCKSSLGKSSLRTGMRHRRIGGNHAMKCRVMNVDMAVGLVGMSAGQSWRELNGDQNHRRANKLPDISVRVHQAHDIRGYRHRLASRQGWLMCGAGLFIFQSCSGRQWFRVRMNGPPVGHRVYSRSKLNTITVEIPSGRAATGTD